MHQTQAIARFARRASFDQLSQAARACLKLHLLDSLACAFSALDHAPIEAVRAQVEELGAGGPCTAIGGGSAAPDRAALWNGALVRYVDFMDNYLAPQQTGHPCDTLASVLAAAEFNKLSGRDFLAALSAAYQVFCRLIDDVPVQEHGFDHTVQLAYAIAAGVSRALCLPEDQAANALAIAGASVQGLVVTRADYLSNWKGLQSAHVALGVMNAVFLAKHGITGPLQVLDGKEGFPKAFGSAPSVLWEAEDYERVLHTSLKSYNSEVHTQPVVEAVLELRARHQPRIGDIRRVEVAVFKQAYDITGSGEEAGDKYDVHSKEQADHSLPYLVAVALLDGAVTPAQFAPERIGRADVQDLLRRVRTLRDDLYTARYPSETPCRVVIELDGGHELVAEKTDWKGFYKRPLDWEDVVSKFETLTAGHLSPDIQRQICDVVAHLEDAQVSDLTHLL